MPIACTLAPGDVRARRALIESLAADAVLERVPTDAGLRVRFRATPDIERRTRELVDAESRCCPFLVFALTRAAGELVLDVSGPAEARPLVEAFFD